MNDLATIEKVIPNIGGALKRAAELFDSVHSFADIERVFLRGQGLSPNTYRAYLTSVKQFYSFTNGLNPLQVTPADIERFYDDLIAHVDRNTAYLRIRGLKKFFAGIRNVLPIYTSPFEIMPKKLQRKLNTTKKGNRTKAALTDHEINALLAFLRADSTLKGKQNYAAMYMLVTSGLRASELCSLRWHDIENVDGAWSARFIGKGNKEAEQELYASAIETVRDTFRAQFRRQPTPDEALFWTVPQFKGDTPRAMPYHTLWYRVKEAGENAKKAEVIQRDIQFTPHLFRRSYATALYRSGMKIKAIQEKTRHASIDTLVKHYIHDEEPATPYLDKVFGSIYV